MKFQYLYKVLEGLLVLYEAVKGGYEVSVLV